MIIGLTGRVGSGKSLAVTYIKAYFPQVNIIDLDLEGHGLYSQPSIQEALLKTFGASIFKEHTVDRQALSSLVFSDSNALKQLNAVMHPALKCQVEFLLTQLASPVLIVGALLKEIQLLILCDQCIVIDTEDDLSRQFNPQKFDKIAPFQLSRQQYLDLATHTVKNGFDSKFEQSIVECVSSILQTSGPNRYTV